MIADEMVEAALAAFNDCINTPLMVVCEKCDGKGYHHGFGEDGHDPDWCTECGGGSYAIVPGEEQRAMRAALQAAAALDTRAGVSRPERVQAAFDTWRKSPDLGPNATAMFDYIVTLEAALAAPPAPVVPDGWKMVPEDLLTHLVDWEAACKIAYTHADVLLPDIDDRSYWEKQLKTIVCIRAMLAAAPLPPGDAT